MVSLVQSTRSEVAALCHKFHVNKLELFGSAATDRFDETSSDLDFLVQFAPCTPRQHYERFFGLLESLEGLFSRRVDLIEIGSLRNPFLIDRINESRALIYAA